MKVLALFLFVFLAPFQKNDQLYGQSLTDQTTKISPPSFLQGTWYEEEAINSMNSIRVTGNNIFFNTKKGNHFNAIRGKHDVNSLMTDLKKDNNPDVTLYLKEELPNRWKYILSYGIKNDFVTIEFQKTSSKILIVDLGDHKPRKFVLR